MYSFFNWDIFGTIELVGRDYSVGYSNKEYSKIEINT